MIISVMEEWPGGHESNLLAYVWIQGICSGEKVRPVLMMLRVWWWGVMVAYCPGEAGVGGWGGHTHTQSHDPQYK